jgi:hypothetical protein
MQPGDWNDWDWRHGRRGRGRRHGRGPGGGSPIVALLILAVFAVVAFGSLASILANIAGGLVMCGVPIAVVGFIIWAIQQNQKKDGTTSGDAGGTAGQDVMRAPAPPVPPASAKPPPVGSLSTLEALLKRLEAQSNAGARPQESTQPKAQTAQPQAQAAQPEAKAAPARGKTTAQAAPAPAYVPEKGLRSPAEYRKRAASYRKNIQSLINKRRKGPMQERLTVVLTKLTSWETRVIELTDRIVLFETDPLIQRDFREVPNHIARLRRQCELEADPEMCVQVKRVLTAYEEQQRQLELLAKAMKRTRLSLDDTLAAMGTVYSQVQAVNVMDLEGNGAAEIAAEIEREIDRLNDLLQAMDDVYLPKPAGEVEPEGTSEAARRARLESESGGR